MRGSFSLSRLTKRQPAALPDPVKPLLWEQVKPCNKPYNYHPRGRVEYTAKGKAVVYMNPHIEEKYIAEIKAAFGITTEPEIRYDHSRYYKCCLD